MNKQEYMEQLKKRLKRLPGEDFERAVEYRSEERRVGKECL